MARNSSTLDIAITLPWWFNLLLAAALYTSLKYILPSIDFSNQIFHSLITALQNAAGYFSSIFIITALISAFHSWRKGELIERQTSVKSVQDLSWKEFEYLVSEAFKRKGFSVIENMQPGPDGGIDLVLLKENEKTLVQCKNWKSKNVGVSVIRELFGIVISEGASHGIVVCSDSYSRDAKTFAAKNNIELISGRTLAKLISTVQIKPKIKVNNASSECPICRSHMVHRVARKVKYAGSSFLGCSRFPKCRGTRKFNV